MSEHPLPAGAISRRADARLLIVDDNEDNRYTLMRRLRREGYSDLVIATNGREALDALCDHRIDLVLLDIMMPEMNGYEVLERMKGDALLAGIPVIMISAVDELESVVRCIELGAEDYLAKPFNATLLRARVGASLEKKRLRDEIMRHVARMEDELAQARAIQRGMVPSVFPPASAAFPVDIHAALLPAFEVGGDLYDFFACGEQTLCIVVADVSGKGVAAALFMARTKGLIHTTATLLARANNGRCPQPAEIVAHVNEELCRDNPGSMFVTLFMAVLDMSARTLSYCNAGHNCPYLVRTGARAVALTEARGKLLGISADAQYQTHSQALEIGELVFLFTDGITEAENPAGEFFEDARLETSLSAAAGEDARGVVEAAMAAVREFAGAARQSDDIAALGLRITS